MKNIVYVAQHEDWEDNGGDHNPSLITISDEAFAELEVMSEADVLSDDLYLRLGVLVENAPSLDLPCEIHAVYNFWHAF